MRFEYEFGDIADENNDLVAKVENHDHGALLAAAPELLAALEAYVQYFSDYDEGNEFPGFQDMMARAGAAIARAMGRAYD